MNIIFTKQAEKELSKLDKTIQKKIKKYVLELKELKNPRGRGKSLTGNLSGFWRYRISDYRLLCKIEDDKLIISVISVGHRKNIYK